MDHIRDGVDIEHLKAYWSEQQKGAKHMDEKLVRDASEAFIKAHYTCALATGFGSFVRNTPMEYTYMDGFFYFYTEGGRKFIGLENNPNVSICMFDYQGDRNDSHGMQISGVAEILPPRCPELRKVLEFNGIPYDEIKAYEVDVCLIKVKPVVIEMYDTNFVKLGYDVRQSIAL